MMRSMFSAVSGLRNHQVCMDVIGNNIANVNTIGYKGGRVTFQDMLNQTLRDSTAPQGDLGGTNPQQVGLGMLVRTIDTVHTQGSLESTGKLTDLAIQGEGFFVLHDGTSNKYTRAGNFDINLQKDLVDPATGMKVQGWVRGNSASSPTEINITLPTTSINIPLGQLMVAEETENVVLAGNLDADPSGDGSVSVQVYDSLGVAHTLTLTFTQTAANTWSWDSVIDGGSTSVGSGTTTFDADGTFSAQTGTISIALTNGATTPLDITPDFSSLTQFSSTDSNVIARSQDGFPMGVLENFTIGTDGIITGVFSNGMSQTLARIALAVCGNPGGLLRVGGTMFRQSANSGDVRLVAPAESGVGSIIPGSLEMSNVDLAQEFTKMITTQRGFQANSRIITTSDEMLQELVNMKR
jgi:flagellar hook protein FlgE